MKISAKDNEEFLKIQKQIELLPEEVSAQIQIAETSLLGVQCTLREAYGDSNKISLPSPINQLVTYESEDRAICGEFCFIIPKKQNSRIHYSVVK